VGAAGAEEYAIGYADSAASAAIQHPQDQVQEESLGPRNPYPISAFGFQIPVLWFCIPVSSACIPVFAILFRFLRASTRM